jgi:hypothetical protein
LAGAADEPPPETRAPAGDTANQLPPKADTPSPFVSPGLVSLMNV